MQGSASFGLSVDVYTCLDQQSAGGTRGEKGGQLAKNGTKTQRRQKSTAAGDLWLPPDLAAQSAKY